MDKMIFGNPVRLLSDLFRKRWEREADLPN